MSTLYRKYRPNKFSEISGQAHVVKTLSNAIKNQRIGQAYLFTGPRGTGKTTLARIFSKAVNCLSPVIIDPKADPLARQEPCNQCQNCRLIIENKTLDLIEIDAASNTGVDNIRQLKETVVLPPSSLKYKIYIIDEVHMLSSGAFNALLKTLEEPPAHAIFILATTELQKIPETILSRCQRFDFSRLNQDQIIQRLREISKLEKVEIDAEALEIIALEAEGGMRDAESLLGQIISLEDKKITTEEVNQILGTSSKKIAIDFISNMIEDRVKDTLKKIDQLQSQGVSLKNFNKNILAYLRSLMLLKANPKLSDLITSLTREQIDSALETIGKTTLEELMQLADLFQKSLRGFKDTPFPQLPLELAVIEHHLSKSPSVPSPAPTIASFQVNQSINQDYPPKNFFRPNPIPTPADTSALNPEKIKPSAEKNPKNEHSGPPQPKQMETNPAINIEQVLDKWADILEEIKPHNHSIQAFLKNCTPAGIIGNQLYIKAKYDFYKEKLNEAPNRLTVQQVIAKIIGAELKAFFVTDKEALKIKFEKSQSGSEENHNILHDAMQIMGGKIIK